MNQADAMGAGSLLVIDEVVLPEDRSTMSVEQAKSISSLGVTTNMVFGKNERRESEWYAILNLAGFVLKDVRFYTHCYDAVLVAALSGAATRKEDKGSSSITI